MPANNVKMAGSTSFTFPLTFLHQFIHFNTTDHINWRRINLDIRFFVLYWTNNHAAATPLIRYCCILFCSSLPHYNLEKGRWVVLNIVIFKVLTAVTKDNTKSWVVMPCSSDRARRFGGTRRLYRHGRRASQAGNQ
jgi:hypothetical protein